MTDKRYRLLARAEMDGTLRDPGYEFTLPKDEHGKEIRGPHRTITNTPDFVDEPLYEEVKEVEPVKVAPPPPVASKPAAAAPAEKPAKKPAG